MQNDITNLSENQIQNAIMGLLRYKGYYVQRMNSGALRDKRDRLVRMNRAGTPDIMAFKTSIVSEAKIRMLDLLFIEVKRPGKKPTPLQIEVMKEMEEHGARCIVAHSVEEVENVL